MVAVEQMVTQTRKIDGAEITFHAKPGTGVYTAMVGDDIFTIHSTKEKYAKDATRREDGSMSAPSYVVSSHSWIPVIGTPWTVSTNARALQSAIDAKHAKQAEPEPEYSAEELAAAVALLRKKAKAK